MKRLLWCALGIMFCFQMSSMAQAIYEDTLWIKVTFYDFHSDKTNPEFEPTTNSYNRYRKLVAQALDADRKPYAGDSTFFSRYVKYWFRPWADSAAKDYTRPVYNSNGKLTTIETIGNTNTFKNIVIEDSLPFLHVGGQFGNPQGTYQFENNKQQFFPLDGTGLGFLLDDTGFGREGLGHNFSFAMELHTEFEKVDSLTFRFTGDDDVWAYIDGQLRMDIGGIHSATTDSIIVDKISGLVNGQTYKFDFFYAERHTSQSNIKITTNIIRVPTVLSLKDSSDGKCAGDTIFLTAEVKDNKGNLRPEIADSTTWKIIGGDNPASTLLSTVGKVVIFRPKVAYDTAYIEGTVKFGKAILHDTLKIYVEACHPHHVVIERDPKPAIFDTSWLRHDHELTELLIPSDSIRKAAYVIVRDTFGNFIEASDMTSWTITDGAGTLIDSVVNGIASLGQGFVYKKGPPGTGEVAAKSLKYKGAEFTDSVKVVIDNIKYKGLRILDWEYKHITNLDIQAQTCALLQVQAQRTYDLAWVMVPGYWSRTANLSSGGQPPSADSTWNFCPQDTASNGKITVQFAGLSDSIAVNVTPGKPAILKLFTSLTGQTEFVQPPTIDDNRPAGTSIPIFARVFDINGILLGSFNTSSAPIKWSIQEISGTPPTGTLQGPGGNQNALFPTRAYNVVQVKAIFDSAGMVFSDSVRFRIIPGPPDHLTIQIDTDTNGTDLTNISFGPSDTSRLLYPIIRDKWNNFYGIAQQSTWSSRDTLVARASATDKILLGEGIVVRKADSSGVTWADVFSNSTPALHDSIQVDISSVTYDSLQIYLINNGMKIIDTVVIRTDSNQILYARGKSSIGKWTDSIRVKWNVSPGLEVTGTPPPYSQNWNVIPHMVDTGKIFITFPGAVSDTVTAIFTIGHPNSVAIYKKIGNPALSTVQPYVLPPYSDTLIAGSTHPFVAKIFDNKNAWLSQYENNVATEPFFSWQIIRVSGETSTDTLDKKTGSFITFSPKKAYITYKMTVTFQEGTKNITASVNVYVKPGPVHHLVIEPSPNPTGQALNYDTPFPNNAITFGAKDTNQSAYAVLRDANQNFVSTSTSTNWRSVDTLLFRANEGIAILGEGRIKRIGETGQTNVIAFNKAKPSLIDTVRVRATDFSYDSLQIVVHDSIRIMMLEMPSDEDTLLQVLGLRSFDQKWVPVFADWSYTTSNQNLTHPGQQDWLFTPGDTTSSGRITVTLGTAVPYTVFAVITPGPAEKLALYPKRGPVSTLNAEYPNPSTMITAVAGNNFPIVAKIFDHKNVFLTEYQGNKSNLISWSMIELPGFDSSGVFHPSQSSTAQGDSVSFFPVRAYQKVYIVGKLTENSREFLDTILLNIVAGEPKALFIEASSNWQASPNKPNPVDTIRILGNMTDIPVYAILRDAMGNFSRYSTKTTWGVVNNETSVSVWNGVTAIGEGIISRNDSSGFAKVFSVDSSGFRDTVSVVLKAYYYLKLRILVEFDPEPDSLTMPTTSDTTLRVQGLRSDRTDTTIWEFADDGVWEISSNLKVTPIPSIGSQWRFSPTDTGTGYIRVTQNNRVIPPNDTLPDTLYVKFIPGPPSRISARIITPESQRIAGQQIQVLVELFNEDGKIKGPYNFNSAVYKDILPDGGSSKPFVIIGSDTIYLGNSGKEQFIGGVDTVAVVLYYAPWDKDSLHQITVSLDGLKGVTEEFSLIAGDLHHLKIERQEMVVSPVGDTLVLRTTDDLIQLVSIGYDIYGNRRGKENSNWGTDSTLHQITGISQNTPQIVYYLNATENENGNMIAKATVQPAISAKTFIKLIGPGAQLISATTKDIDGDGYLDQIVLKFNKPVTIPEGYDISPEIKYGSISLLPDFRNIIMDPSRTDSVIIIPLTEYTGLPSAQTDWKPTISFFSNEELGIDSVLEHTCIDGAGPVITSVTDRISSNDRKQDVITVTFSEPIQRFDNISLKETDIPSVIFYVWDKDPQGNYVRKDSMLIGINNIVVINDTTISFIMSNGYFFNPSNYFSIRTVVANGDTTALLKDNASIKGIPAPNYPNTNNVQVKVVIIGDPEHSLKMYPNPASPDGRHVPAGTFILRHDQSAHDYIKNGGGGIIFALSFKVPDRSEGVKVRIKLKAYDAVGNPVLSSEEEDILNKGSRNEALNFSAGTTTIEIYWNLFKKTDRIRLAPGMYKVIAYIDYYGNSTFLSNYHNSRKTELFGVRR